MEYSSFLHTSAMLFIGKALRFLSGTEIIHVSETIWSHHFTVYNTHFKSLYFDFTDTFKILFESHNYSKFVHIFTHSLLISTPFHTRKQTCLAVWRFLHTHSIFRLQDQDSQRQNMTKRYIYLRDRPSHGNYFPISKSCCICSYYPIF
jgi:hypothetical protein